MLIKYYSTAITLCVEKGHVYRLSLTLEGDLKYTIIVQRKSVFYLKIYSLNKVRSNVMSCMSTGCQLWGECLNDSKDRAL